MNDSLPNEPRFGDPQPNITRQVAPGDWERAELEAQPEPIAPRERLFPRKVLIGWALFAIALYFGVRVVGTVIKQSFNGAVSTAVDNSGKKVIIYQTPNGPITIRRNNQGIVISRSQPETPPPPATAAGPAKAASPATAASSTPAAPAKR